MVMDLNGWPLEELDQRVQGHGESRTAENLRRAAEDEEQLNIRTDFPAEESALLREKVREFMANR